MAESLTEELTAAQALKELESTAAEELTDAQAVALADDLAYPELTEAQEDALFADDEPKQPLPPPSPPLYDFRPEALAPVARQALAAVRAAGVEWDDDAELELLREQLKATEQALARRKREEATASPTPFLAAVFDFRGVSGSYWRFAQR